MFYTKQKSSINIYYFFLLIKNIVNNNTKDITERQFEILILIELIQHFIVQSNDGDYETVQAVADGMFRGEILYCGKIVSRKAFIEDTCALAKKGYILSDMTEVDEMLMETPFITTITAKGYRLLEKFEKKAVKALKDNKKFVLIDFSGFELNINISLLGGFDVDFGDIKEVGDLFGKLVKRLIQKK